MIIDGTTIHTFDDRQWVIHTPQGRNFLVNEPTYRLFSILQNVTQPDEALGRFNTAFGASFTREQLLELTHEKLGGYHILKDDETTEKPGLKNQYLKLKIELINAKIAGWLSKPFQVFFNPSVFWWSLCGTVLVILTIYFGSNTHNIIQKVNYPLLLTLFYATMLIHELGHIAACAKYGLKHGGIGFGFYFIMPVMYADITNVWLANKQQRIMANMGGIFTELLYASILGIIYLFTNNSTFLTASIGIASFVVWEFNPFVRFDGYWILSDLTNTPNLLKKGNETLFKSLTKNNLAQPLVALKQTSAKTFWLFLYGIINTAFVFGIMGYTLFVYWDTVIHFPIIVWQLLQEAIHLNLTWDDLSRSLITVFIFYMLFIRLTINYLKRIAK